jgi:MFS transporter, DHA2 family, multidrug resistance protein
MTTALRVLDAPIRLYGLAAYALSATFFPALGATVSALWTDSVGVEFAFYQDIPLCALAALLVWFGMPQDEPKYERLAQFDWRGALLIAIGFGSLITLLQQGDRHDWFNSLPMSLLALASVVAIPSFLFNETPVKHPLLKLSLLTYKKAQHDEK